MPYKWVGNHYYVYIGSGLGFLAGLIVGIIAADLDPGRFSVPAIFGFGLFLFWGGLIIGALFDHQDRRKHPPIADPAEADEA